MKEGEAASICIGPSPPGRDLEHKWFIEYRILGRACKGLWLTLSLHPQPLQLALYLAEQRLSLNTLGNFVISSHVGWGDSEYYLKSQLGLDLLFCRFVGPTPCQKKPGSAHGSRTKKKSTGSQVIRESMDVSVCQVLPFGLLSHQHI